MICPIQKKYINERKVVIVNQLFGENKNALFYGPKGHTGIDFRTQGKYKYLYNKIKGFLKLDRDVQEQGGLVPIVAAHDGFLVSPYNDDRKEGIFMKIRNVEGTMETLYFHLDKLRVWKGDAKQTSYEKKIGENFVKAGTVIGWGGNTGKYTTGAHLHFEVREKIGNVWEKVDPMPYLTDSEVLYQRGKRWFYKGKEISSSQAGEIKINLNKVI